MKKLIFTSVIGFIFLSSSFQCKKGAQPLPAEEERMFGTEERATISSTQGKWELRESLGGMGLIEYQPGNGDVFNLTGSKYERYSGETLLKSGTYTIEPDATVEQHICLLNLKDIYKHRIVFDNERKFSEALVQGADTLKPPTVIVQEYGKVFIGFSNKGDTLMLASGCFANDGGSIRKYVKIPGS